MKIHPDIHPSLHKELCLMCGFFPGVAVSSWILSIWYPFMQGVGISATMVFILILGVMKCGRVPGTPKHRKYDDDCAP